MPGCKRAVKRQRVKREAVHRDGTLKVDGLDICNDPQTMGRRAFKAFSSTDLSVTHDITFVSYCLELLAV